MILRYIKGFFIVLNILGLKLNQNFDKKNNSDFLFKKIIQIIFIRIFFIENVYCFCIYIYIYIFFFKDVIVRIKNL